MDNIIILGAGKSGTTFLYYTIREVVEKNDSRCIFEGYKQKEGSGNILAKQLIGSFLEEPTSLKDEDTLNEMISEIDYVFDKKIFMVRDPRDSLISRFFWFHSLKQFEGFEKDFESSLKLIEQKEKNPSSVSLKQLLTNLEDCQNNFYTGVFKQHQYIYNHAIPCILSKQEWFIFRYENLIKENFKNLEKYLGLELPRDKDIVAGHFSHVARTKSYDNWRSFFTQEDVDWLKPKYYQCLKDLNYDAEDWNLTAVDSLDPKNGSEYIKMLFGRE